MREIDFTPVRPGGQFVDDRTNLLFLISFAYDVKNPSLQLVGLPDWAKRRAFSVSAKGPSDAPAVAPAENRERVRRMLRAMLEDRFQLRVRTETRQEPVLRLEVAKTSANLKPVDAPVPPATETPVGAAMGDDGGRMIGKTSTMASLAGALTLFLKRRVVDGTGLPGYYDFDIKWKATERPDGSRPESSFGAEGAGLLVSELQGQLGLRLAKAVGPVVYWVVDRVELPSGN